MKLYFSGIASKAEAGMLARAATTTHLLADPRDWRHLDWQSADTVALDSGAYRAFKAGTPLDIDSWSDQVTDCVNALYSPMLKKSEASRNYEKLRFITMPDVFGDPSATWDRWRILEDKINDGNLPLWSDRVIPVWQWGAPIEHLESMVQWCRDATQSNLDDCEYLRPRADCVAIGGCVPWMRANDKGALAELVALAKEYGQWFHVLGLNWLDAMMTLDPHVRSCDTSKWLDGARYGTWISDMHGRLVVEEKRTCPRGRERAGLCEQCAITLENWVNKQLRGTAAPKNRTVRRYVLKPFVPPAKPLGPVNHLLLMHSMAENERRHKEAKENFIDELRWKRK